MRIRATILTPVLAVFTVVALIGTGVVINQTRHQDASATALDSVPDSAAVADAGLTGSLEPVAPVSVRSSSRPSNPAETDQEEFEVEEDEEEPDDESHAEAEEDD